MNKSEKALISDPQKYKSVKNRLFRKLTKNTETGCLEWSGGATANGGYGSVAIGRGLPPLRAHRAAWIFENGAIPDGLFVCHKCDNPKCCNVDHLFLGTPKQNMLDKEEKGRGTKPPTHSGEQHHNSKMTFADVNAVRESDLSTKDLAEKYGVSRQTIYRIRKFLTRVDG